MQLYDTKEKRLVEVVPASSGTVDIYCCGPTVYRFAHVGNLRTFLLGDLVRRTLKAEGVAYRYIQNITDVGHLNDDVNIEVNLESGQDKILAQAKLEKKDPFEIARFYESAFHADLKALNILPADAYPKASESIDLITDLIAQLIYIGSAYQGGDGSMYFAARSFKGYGAISHNTLENLQAGYRFDATQSETEPGKRFHADWALWKIASENREMTWQTPWGVGFPGWHIECSAMSLHYFPQGVSLHLGGIDLRFPHHENERAQSNSATNSEFVRQWVHGEHLLFEGKKMAKSSGNVLHVADLVERGIDPLALRLLFLESHYRTQMNLTWETIEAADATLKRWRKKISTWQNHNDDKSDTGPDTGPDKSVSDQILALFANDLDTSGVMLLLRKIERDETISGRQKRAIFLTADALLGLNLEVPEPERVELRSNEQQLLTERERARANSDWPKSDELRAKLLDLGIRVTDGPAGQSWERI